MLSHSQSFKPMDNNCTLVTLLYKVVENTIALNTTTLQYQDDVLTTGINLVLQSQSRLISTLWLALKNAKIKTIPTVGVKVVSQLSSGGNLKQTLFLDVTAIITT
jgi:hypothetical protein